MAVWGLELGRKRSGSAMSARMRESGARLEVKVVLMDVRQSVLRSCPPRYRRRPKLHYLAKIATMSTNISAAKMLGVDYASSDEEEAVPAIPAEVRLTNVREGLR